jgi:hypothetical protein
MTPEHLLDFGIKPALSLLPAHMDKPAARALLLAIALQESGAAHRRQIGGPAKSYFQFERAGVVGVLNHRASAAHAGDVCHLLDIEATVDAVHAAIEFSDLLASAFARLLLWTLPEPLPKSDETDLGWSQYVGAWRPGRPRPEDWPDNFARGWTIINARKALRRR